MSERLSQGCQTQFDTGVSNTVSFKGLNVIFRLYNEGIVTFIQSRNYIQPFECICEADLAPGENNFDTSTV